MSLAHLSNYMERGFLKFKILHQSLDITITLKFDIFEYLFG